MKNPRLLYILPALVLVILAIVSLVKGDYSYLTVFQGILGLLLLVLAFSRKKIV